ncbi:general stress protein [Arthrobacter roseus]|uniref:general stress protein n=1 Tax=Arthrobacter roseus TaxID=136274 RepID=UPI00196453E1|nr:general stress protein [Arthrobacter roseus]MBM7849180.1 hypothetical protein [Arthrobacter roseus]
MSNVFGRTQSRDGSLNLPRGESIGRYSSYLDAQKAVDYLADQQFAVQHVSIIGSDLKTVERVTGRLSYPRVALSSAATGAWFGFFVGLVLMLFAGETEYLTVLSTMALGAGFWLFFGIITYAFQRGKRDFTSTSQVVATSYEVIVDPSVIIEAKKVLQGMNGEPVAGQAQQTTAPSADVSEGQTPAASTATDSDHAEGTQPEQGQTPRGQFADLADGRPQYGIRTPDAEAPTAGRDAQSEATSNVEPDQRA